MRQTSHIERLEIIDDMDKRNETIDEMYNKGYRVISVGPLAKKNGRANLTKFRLVAEKQITTPGEPT